MNGLSDDELKEIGEEIAEIVRQHGLQHSPKTCRELFNHMADVIDGWNSPAKTLKIELKLDRDALSKVVFENIRDMRKESEA